MEDRKSPLIAFLGILLIIGAAIIYFVSQEYIKEKGLGVFGSIAGSLIASCLVISIIAVPFWRIYFRESIDNGLAQMASFGFGVILAGIICIFIESSIDEPLDRNRVLLLSAIVSFFISWRFYYKWLVGDD
jgi:hypothetical protein